MGAVPALHPHGNASHGLPLLVGSVTVTVCALTGLAPCMMVFIRNLAAFRMRRVTTGGTRARRDVATCRVELIPYKEQLVSVPPRRQDVLHHGRRPSGLLPCVVVST